MKANADIQRVGVYGGTFDPIHAGHVAIVQAFLKSSFIDAVWVTPTPNPPFKSRKTIEAFAHRMAMAEIEFKDQNRVFVSDIESRIEGVSYTYKTLNKLRDEFPLLNWHLCIGSDNLEVFHKWKNYQEIINENGLLVAARPNFNIDVVKRDVLGKAQFVDHVPLQISSTDIRKELKDTGTSTHLNPKVLEYIKYNNLYGLSNF